jgi:hypothetical protein
VDRAFGIGLEDDDVILKPGELGDAEAGKTCECQTTKLAENTKVSASAHTTAAPKI